MIVLVSGDRWFERDYGQRARNLIYKKIERNRDKIDFIVQGGAEGADKIAHESCRKLGMTSITVFADWARQHRAAGAIRNIKMAKDWEPDLILAFHNDIENSKGTKNMINYAIKNGIKWRLYNIAGKRIRDVND